MLGWSFFPDQSLKVQRNIKFRTKDLENKVRSRSWELLSYHRNDAASSKATVGDIPKATDSKAWVLNWLMKRLGRVPVSEMTELPSCYTQLLHM